MSFQNGESGLALNSTGPDAAWTLGEVAEGCAASDRPTAFARRGVGLAVGWAGGGVVPRRRQQRATRARAGIRMAVNLMRNDMAGDKGQDAVMTRASTGRRMPIGDVHSAVTSKLAPLGGETLLHSYSVRICHWINVIACGYLLVSGVHILLDFPELSWGHTGYRGYPAIFRLSDWGLSWEAAGALGDRRWGATITSLSPGSFLQWPHIRGVESLHGAFSQADAAGP